MGKLLAVFIGVSSKLVFKSMVVCGILLFGWGWIFLLSVTNSISFLDLSFLESFSLDFDFDLDFDLDDDLDDFDFLEAIDLSLLSFDFFERLFFEPFFFIFLI